MAIQAKKQMEFYKALFFKYYPICSILESESESCPVMSDSLQPHGILQARILKWVAIPFSWGSSQPRCPTLQADSLPAEPPGKVKLLSYVQFFVTPWTVAPQAPLSMGILQARILERIAMPSSRGSSQPRDQTQVSNIAGGFFTV